MKNGANPLDQYWDGNITRVPLVVYTDPDIYQREHEAIFRGPVWHFLGLEIEVPNEGDYLATSVGDIGVLIIRKADGSISAVVNRCSHKGSSICNDPEGNTKNGLTCPYHNWIFDLDGNLQSVAFRHGVRGEGGMPSDFNLSNHNLERLRVEVLHGIVFGTFHPEALALQNYLTPVFVSQIAATHNRPMVLLGKTIQSMACNWKLYVENTRDTYHSSLLHSFATTFRIQRLSLEGGLIQSDNEWHHTMWARTGTENDSEGSYAAGALRATSSNVNELADPNLIKTWPEHADGKSTMIMSIFPSIVFQRQGNSIALRHLVPRGPNRCDLVWRFLGYEDDTEELRLARVRQANLFGPGGLVSYEDGVVVEWVHRNAEAVPEGSTVTEMGGRGIGSSGGRATETSIRAFYKKYHELMQS